jgi:hypothetical protein
VSHEKLMCSFSILICHILGFQMRWRTPNLFLYDFLYDLYYKFVLMVSGIYKEHWCNLGKMKAPRGNLWQQYIMFPNGWQRQTANKCFKKWVVAAYLKRPYCNLNIAPDTDVHSWIISLMGEWIDKIILHVPSVRHNMLPSVCNNLYTTFQVIWFCSRWANT